tara:strand:+ start:1622 stop:2230 length:609 start_codon:yes stop_codon:yes gene_type:complete
MIINHNKRFIFVAVAKTACTSIRRSLGYTKDPLPLRYHMNLKDMINQNPETENYFKFGFVRNPYYRLVSAFFNFRNSNTHGSIPPYYVPFYEYNNFRDFVLDLDKMAEKIIHLKTQYDYLEYKGGVGVDFIGRFENLNEDFETVKSLIGIESEPLGIHRQHVSGLNGVARKSDNYMDEYDEETKEITYRFYKKDFMEFGYEK